MFSLVSTSWSAFAVHGLEVAATGAGKLHDWNGAMTDGVSCRMARHAFIAIIAAACAARRAIAQAPPPPTAARSDTAVHRLAVDATKIQTARSSYRLQLARDSVISALGDQEFTVTTLDYAGTPAFLLARSGTQGVTSTSDSLVVRRIDLHPLHWIASQGVARVAVEFTVDSIFGALTSPLGRQNVVLPNRDDLLINMMDVDVILGALPLAAAWRDSAQMLLLDPGGAAITPVSLAVEGEERVTVPAGEFDCWIVSLETERASARVWLTKQGQIVLRSEQVLPELGGATLTRILVQTDSPALMPASARLPQ